MSGTLHPDWIMHGHTAFNNVTHIWKMSLIDDLSICLISRGWSAFWDRRPSSYKPPYSICPSDSCICTSLPDEKDLAADAELAGTAAQRACFGWGESGWIERERHICPTLSSLWSFVPSGLAGSQTLMGLVWLRVCRQKHINSSWSGSANIVEC